jgi:OmpA-OmpF porin, OOP family
VRVLVSLEALSLLNSGSMTVRPDTIEIAGETGRQTARDDISRILTSKLGEGAGLSLDVTYVEALDPVAALPTPEECVEMINTAIAVRKITFAPGSAEIDADALETIDKVAEALKECQTVKMEIGGHTDSQGRETMNERLSQERADAVLNAIMGRRVLTSNLTARGYGETRPIADNDTEDGREAKPADRVPPDPAGRGRRAGRERGGGRREQ